MTYYDNCQHCGEPITEDDDATIDYGVCAHNRCLTDNDNRHLDHMVATDPVEDDHRD